MAPARFTGTIGVTRVDTGKPVPEAFAASVVIASSNGLGWDGVQAQTRKSGPWSPTWLSFDCHYLAINLDDKPFITERNGPRGLQPAVLAPGAVWIIAAGAPFSFRTRGPSRRLGSIQISPDKVRRTLGYDIEPRDRFGITDVPLSAVARSLLFEAESGGASGALFADAMAVALAARLECHDAKERRRQRGGLTAGRLTLVRERIEECIGDTITVAGLAAIVGLSPAHFAREFKQRTDETVHGYVLRRRLERARELLMADNAVASAALECGFADQAHLSRAFKKRFGASPSAFVRVARGKRVG